jgi:hypothetical protein
VRWHRWRGAGIAHTTRIRPNKREHTPKGGTCHVWSKRPARRRLQNWKMENPADTPQRPLTGFTTWVEYTCSTVVRSVWNGRANLVELVVDGPAGDIKALSLRLFNSQSGQRRLNFCSSGSGSLGNPSIGGCKNGRGAFIHQETSSGKAILVRFVRSDIAPISC